VTETLALFGGPKVTAEPFPAWPRLSEKALAEAAAALASGRLVQSAGTRVAGFEAGFAAWVGAPHAVAVASGTAALHAALAALGVGPGDEVIVPSHTFVATPLAILHAGARPVFCDVTDDQTIDPRALDELATPRTRAVIVVHLYGVVCDMGRILERTRARSIAVVEDCAQALGGEWQGRRAGTLGDAGCFSFSQVKHLTTAGEGGMMVTAREEVAGRGRRRAAARTAGVELPPHRGPGSHRAGRA
jgi:dTDP-4-amino-4,6-dideoxygalactose transaminase